MKTVADINRKETEGFIFSRADIYRFLARIYGKEVDQGLLALLFKNKKLATIDCDEIGQGYGMLKRFAGGCRQESVVEDLGADYAALFLGCGKNTVAPYASVYLSNQKLMCQEQRNQIMEVYRKSGFVKRAEFKEPEDHIAIELEFMSCLCQRAADALKDGDVGEARGLLEVQNSFLIEHLKPWVNDFCDDVADNAALYFYEAVAKITKGFLSIEEENIPRLMSELS